MTEPKVKDLIENTCLNEYRYKRERSVKINYAGTPKGMLVVYTNISLLAQI